MNIVNQKMISYKSAGKVISVFILIIGLLLCSSGIGFFIVGEMGISRYEKTGGKLIRFFSDEDQRYYSYLNTLIFLGYGLEITGLLTAAVGVYGRRKPEVCSRIFFKN